MSDYATARLNMVESQVRPNEVTDPRLLDAMLTLPREVFVPASLRPIAYMDEEILFDARSHLAETRCMMAPMTLAQLINAADVEDGNIVLDIGCTTGYSSAILARLAEAVVAWNAMPRSPKQPAGTSSS